jgi:DNA-binding transcriptional ArsR family regulator
VGVTDRRVHDPTVLRAIAHPIRNRILGEMAATGPTRAADLAADLDLPANTVSFHLRQLAKYGLIEEAPDQARDRRDRVWKLVARGLTIDVEELSRAPGGEAAVAVFQKSAGDWAHRVVDAAYSTRKDPEALRSISDVTLRLTKDEALELGAELEGLLQQWQRRTQGRDPARRTYLLLSILQPHPGVDE